MGSLVISASGHTTYLSFSFLLSAWKIEFNLNRLCECHVARFWTEDCFVKVCLQNAIFVVSESQTELRNYLTSPHSSFLWRLECVWQRTEGEEVDCHSKVTIVVAVKTRSFSNVESLVTCEQPWSWNKTLRKFECSQLRPLRCLESDPRLVVSTTTLSTKLSNI